MVIAKYYSLHSTFYDLGVFVNQLYKLSSYEELSLLFAGHAHPYLKIYSYIFSVVPKNYAVISLLAIQSLSLLLPVIWLIKYYSVMFAVVYLLYFPLWFNLLNDFHLDHLAVPMLFAFFILVEKKHYILSFVVVILLVFVKEPFALQAVACGVYLIIFSNSYERVRVYLGLGLIVFGFSYFHIVIDVVFPVFTNYNGRLDSAAFSWLGSNTFEVIYFIVTHPLQIINQIFFPSEKIIYIIALFGSLGFISLLYPKPLLVAIPVLFISLVSTNPSHYGVGNHYTAGLIAPIIYSFIYGLARAQHYFSTINFTKKIFLPTVLLGVFIAHVVLSPSPVSRLFWIDKIWSYNYKAYFETDRTKMIKDSIELLIPKDPGVSVSVQNSLNWETLVIRDCSFVFPYGVIAENHYDGSFNDICMGDREDFVLAADYVVLDLKRPWFVYDKGCTWLYGKCDDEVVEFEYKKWVKYTKKIMKTVFEKDGFLILKRN